MWGGGLGCGVEGWGVGWGAGVWDWGVGWRAGVWDRGCGVGCGMEGWGVGWGLGCGMGWRGCGDGGDVGMEGVMWCGDREGVRMERV